MRKTLTELDMELASFVERRELCKEILGEH